MDAPLLTELCPDNSEDCVLSVQKRCPDMDEECLRALSQMDYYLVGRDSYVPPKQK